MPGWVPLQSMGSTVECRRPRCVHVTHIPCLFYAIRQSMFQSCDHKATLDSLRDIVLSFDANFVFARSLTQDAVTLTRVSRCDSRHIVAQSSRKTCLLRVSRQARSLKGLFLVASKERFSKLLRKQWNYRLRELLS